MGAVLRHVLLLQRVVPAAVRFYSEGLGLAVNVCTERWAELQSGPTRLGLKGVDGCAARGGGRVRLREGGLRTPRPG